MPPNLTTYGEKNKPERRDKPEHSLSAVTREYVRHRCRRCPESQEVISTINPLILPDYESLSQSAAGFIADQLRANPSLLLCTATGASPTRAYDLLVAQREHEPHLFDSVRVLKLDEWGGLPMHDEGTCEMYLHQHLIQPLGIAADRYISFDSDAQDPGLECRRIQDELKKQGPISLCVLGLGANGHLALNEPADELCPHAHVARLSEQSLKHPMLVRSRQQPSYGMTLGMADILHSTTILLLVSGAHKREVLQRFLSAAISTQFPASFLWLHKNVTVMSDKYAVGAVA